MDRRDPLGKALRHDLVGGELRAVVEGRERRDGFPHASCAALEGAG